MKPEILLWLDDHRGRYIPRDFANCFVDRDRHVQGVSPERWAILENPDDEYYWEAWNDVLNDATVTMEGVVYRLHQDGALWLVPEGMEWNDDSETFEWSEEDE